MKPSLPTLELQYRRSGDLLPSLQTQLGELYRLSQKLSNFSPLLRKWYLTSDTNKQDALLHEVFDSSGPTTVAMAVLREETEVVHDLRTVSIWNGADTTAESAGISSRCNVVGRPDMLTFRLKVRPEVPDWRVGVDWIQSAVSIWPALFATFSPFWYGEKAVFKDRPGVGWMLYLPRVLTVQQVPEARALVPVMGKDEKGKDRQAGTIIVSVTDDAFSDENPEHVKIANAIEIRLVDQDLLPRYSDL